MASQIIGSTYIEGLKAPHYINRRLLTAEDLKADQQATLLRLGTLGKAAGYGVAEGLEVDLLGSATLRVNTGLGFNRSGKPIRLPQITPLSFSAPAAASAGDRDAGRFQDCALASGGIISGVPDQGAYLLTAAPISRLEGSAAVKSAAGSTATPACAAQWEVEGLQFRAIRLDAFDSEADLTVQNRRNRLAHWCYGSTSFPALERDYLAMPEQYGGLSLLSAQDLTNCDLPLAVFHWSGSAISDVDTWSVRRRLTQSGAITSFSGLIGDRRSAEGQARFMQFQTQLAGLSGGTNVVSAPTALPFLPPAGLVRTQLPGWLLMHVAQPLIDTLTNQVLNFLPFFGLFDQFRQIALQRLNQVAAQTVQQTSQSGLDPAVFFGKLPARYGLIDPDGIDDIIRQSWYHNAFAIASTTPYDLYLPYADVVQLIAPALRASMLNALQNIPFFDLPAIFTNEIERLIRQRIAELTAVTLEQVTFSSVQPVTLFAKQLRPTEFVNTPNDR